MSQIPLSAQNAAALGQSSALAGVQRTYQLVSDLARLSLPAATRDVNRKLAWANSLCFLFLTIGLIGLHPPKVVLKPLTEVTEVVPVIFTPPEQPKVEPVIKPDEPEPTPDTVIDTPQIATVVAADPAAAAFAVPVEGPVILAPARYAAPPPPAPPKPSAAPSATRFERGKVEGIFPEPEYPMAERRERHQGDVLLLVTVDASGVPVSVEVKDDSGFLTLDRHTVQWVKKNWRWAPGDTRQYLIPFTFQLR